MLSDTSLGNFFLDLSSQAKKTKANMNMWDYIKPKSLYRTRKTINKTKRLLIKWEKTFVNNITNKGLISKLYRKFIQLNIKIPTTLLKIAVVMNRLFFSPGKA